MVVFRSVLVRLVVLRFWYFHWARLVPRSVRPLPRTLVTVPLMPAPGVPVVRNSHFLSHMPVLTKSPRVSPRASETPSAMPSRRSRLNLPPGVSLGRRVKGSRNLRVMSVNRPANRPRVPLRAMSRQSILRGRSSGGAALMTMRSG
ncbi:hypothetical protein SFUMM280S_10521 [Streptomyces fumanus]